MGGFIEGAWMEYTYLFRCTGCEEECEIRTEGTPLNQNFDLGLQLWRPTLPEGWQVLNGSIYCPAHTILVVPKGGGGTRKTRHAVKESVEDEQT